MSGATGKPVGARRPGWQLAALALALLLAALVLVELGLRALSLVPPDDPLLFFARSHEARFDPFVEGAGGSVAIRPDWVNRGTGMRGKVGKRAGRQFLYPGFRPANLARSKPAGALRIFTLGGSTTFGLYAGAEAAFSADLARRLRSANPGRDVEVANLGCAGFASDRVLGLFEPILALDPDLLVIYSGHNETLAGDVGVTRTLDPALRLRARLLRTSTLFAWWNHALANTLRAAESEQIAEEVAALQAGQIPTFIPEALPPGEMRRPDPAFRARAATRYRANLEAMVVAAAEAGTPLLFVLPVANLLVPPYSLHAEGFAETAAFRGQMRAAQALLEAGKAAEALERADAAVALAPDYGGARFRRAQTLLALGRMDAAREAFQRAIDVDVRTYRITSPLIETFVSVMRETGTPWVDLRPEFHATLDEATADLLFSDHLHPTAEGHARIGALLAAKLSALPQ